MAEENSNECLRLFVAITIPEPVRNEMARVQQELKPLALGDVRWTKAEQLHLTLKFLGNVPAGSLEAVKQSLAEACAGTRPFPLRARGIGIFPNERQPRVVWVGFESDEKALTDLQLRVEQLLAPYAEKPGSPRGVTTNHANPTADNSTPRGKERFLPHATLGRFQKYRRNKTEKLLPRAAALAGHVFGEWRVAEIVLFRSELSADGARHTQVAVFPFGANLKGETY
jgi:RNA 2',3'-cyclic 3'-phosphodiesterase